MEIKHTYGGREVSITLNQSEIRIGRPDGVGYPDLDLSPDLRVSRRHARIWWENEAYWIEDLGSRFGTYLNGELVQNRQILSAGDVLLIGESVIEIASTGEPESIALPPPPPPPRALRAFVAAPAPAPAAAVTPAPAAHHAAIPVTPVAVKAVVPSIMPPSEQEQALQGLAELPHQAALARPVDEILQIILEKTLKLVPRSMRGMIALLEDGDKAFKIHASVAMNLACLEEELARRALSEQSGFKWQGGAASTTSTTAQAGMYAPLLWDEKPLGVMVIDHPNRNEAYSEGDLRLLMAAAQQAAIAIMLAQTQQSALLMRRMLDGSLRMFSPAQRNRLIERLRRPGAQPPPPARSELVLVGISLASLFQASGPTADVETAETVSDYLPVIGDAIHKFEGLVHRASSDSVVGVFGAIETDDKPMDRAVRCALALQWALQGVNARREARKKSVFNLGAAVHLGVLFHGYMGPFEQLDYVIQGEPLAVAVQLAALVPVGETWLSAAVQTRLQATVVTDRVASVPAFEKEPPVRLKGFKDQAGYGALQTVRLPH